MKTEKMYGVAIRKKTGPDDFFWKNKDYIFEACKIDCNDHYWLADPFVYEKDDNTYIFFEALDLITRVGKIGYSIRNHDGSFTKPRIVIDEPCHLSFPNIFEYQGDIYIMPESCGDWQVKLFKAKSFPNKWESADYLLPDVYACDSIFIERDNERWLLANEMYHNTPVDNYSSCWVKNYLYKMNGLKVCGNGEKVSEGDFGIRNAGQSFWSEGKQYRIGQDCRYRQYGRGLSLFEIHSLEPYNETMLWSMDCKEIAPHIRLFEDYEIIGVHTYNSSTHWEIIDYSQMRPLSLRIKLLRTMFPISRRFRSLINK